MIASSLHHSSVIVPAARHYAARSLAACSPLDLDCFGDSLIQTALTGLAAYCWWWVRMYLIVVRGLEGVQDWLVTNVLGTAFSNFLLVLKPYVLMAAALAILIFVGAQALIAFVQHSWVDLRRAIWAGLTSMAIFAFGATGLASVQQFHMYGSQLFSTIGLSAVQQATGSTLLPFYTTTTTTDAMPAVVSLYATAAPQCPLKDLRRTRIDPASGQRVNAPDQFYLNDYTALYVYATATDIHCPPSEQYLPATFTDTFFAKTGDSFTILLSHERDAQLGYAIIGILRLLVAGVLGWGAIAERLLHLVFVLALMAALFGYAASRLIAFFVPFAGLERQQRDALITVFAYSWMSAFWIGLFLGLTHIAAQTNALIAGPMALVTVGVVLVRFWRARQPLMTAMVAANTMAGSIPGAMLSATVRGMGAAKAVVTDGALLAAAAATGGTSAVLMGMARQVGAQQGHSVAGRAAGRHLGRHAATGIQSAATEIAATRAESADVEEIGWWNSGMYANAGTPRADLRALNRRLEIAKQRLDRRRDRIGRRVDAARRQRNWATADKWMSRR